MSKVVHLSNEAHAAAKVYCKENGLKMSDWVASLITKAICLIQEPEPEPVPVVVPQPEPAPIEAERPEATPPAPPAPPDAQPLAPDDR